VAADFLGGIGGNIGLYVGASVISMIEVLLFVLSCLWALFVNMFSPD
jgi:hypothetical protein